MMKRVRKIMSLILALCMVFAMNLTTFATAPDGNPAVAEARKGVIQVRVYYIDDTGTEWPLQNGSGFLLGPSTGSTTLITNHHVITLDHEYKDELNVYFQAMGHDVDFHNANDVNLQVRVAVKRDVEIAATYVNGSEKIDFAILELAQPIYDRAPLKVRGSSALTATQQVYALGFPRVQTSIEDDSIYTTEDVTVAGGMINKFHQINDINYIAHSAKTSEGNSGGPLLDSTGAVVGVNTISYGEYVPDSYGSIAIDEVTSVLDALGIEYLRADETATQALPGGVEETQPPTGGGVEETQPPVSVDKTALTAKISAVGALSAEDYTEESWAALQSALAAAQSVANRQDATADEVNAQVSAMQTAIEGLEEAPTMNWGVIAGIAAAVVVVAIIIVAVAAGSKKRSKAPAAGPAAGPVAGPVPPVTPAAPMPPVPPTFGGTMPMDSGAGETSVLGGGAGETSVLGGGSMQPTATLIRKKNGETANIMKPMFVIGKERQKVDFCVPDNNSVSRKHANIVCKGGVYYVVDNNSTNYTFVNGNKINPNQEVKLNSGDKIKLADEEFEFRM